MFTQYLEVFEFKGKSLRLLLLLADFVALLFVFYCIFAFHLVSLSSFLFDGELDEQVVMNFSDWIFPILILGSLTYLYLKYLWGNANYKKMKIYFLLAGLVLSLLFNGIWSFVYFDMGYLDQLFVQLSLLAVTVILLLKTINARKKLINFY
jgi:hypothetical protein